MQSNLRAQAEIQAQRKKVCQPQGHATARRVCAARCGYPAVFAMLKEICTLLAHRYLC
jgi:hypothetical protein